MERSSSPAPEDIMLPPSPPEPVETEQNGSRDSLDTASTSIEPANTTNGLTPTPDATTSPLPTSFNIPPRNRSPLPRTHLRSRSLATPSSAPFMTRAHSSPGVDSRGRLPYSSSEKISPNTTDLPLRRSSPLRFSMDDPAETTLEHPEAQRTATSQKFKVDVGPASPSIHNTYPRTGRRRPSSPLHPNPAGGVSPWGNSSPVLPQQGLNGKFNEPHPSSFSSGSSVPSTPSSIRSRSPSISSLETIPDIPDAEAAAIEADQIARLKAAADKADAAESGDLNRARSAMDMTSSPSSFGSARFNLRQADKRKRWSVCGAEGRHDLDLETIWED